MPFRAEVLLHSCIVSAGPGLWLGQLKGAVGNRTSGQMNKPHTLLLSP